MEQQRDDWETLSYLDQETTVRFFRGCYSCKGVEGSYTTLEGLKDAWIKVMRENKRLELLRLAKELRRRTDKRTNKRGYAENRNYLEREREKWQIVKLGK